MCKNLRFTNEMNSINHNDFPAQNIACRIVHETGSRTDTEGQSHYENKYDKEVSLAADCTKEILIANLLPLENKITQKADKEISGKDKTRASYRRPGFQRPYGRVNVVF